jgi:pimeloyl-ACP methyl ester carboxylesterase
MNTRVSTLLLPIIVSTDLTGQPTKSGYIKAKSLTIYREITGHGPPVFLLHGGLQDHSMWDQKVPVLSKMHQGCNDRLSITRQNNQM